MVGTTNSPKRASAGSGAAARRVEASGQAAAARRAERGRWIGVVGVAVAALSLAVGGVVIVAGGNDAQVAGESGKANAESVPVVGGDLHTVAAIGDALYVAGHEAAAVSRDGGRAWQPVRSLAGADVMAWAVAPGVVLAGGHPGLLRSTDDGQTFSPVTGGAAVPDVHALGGSGSTFYAASAEAGVLASTDAGRSWQVRNAEAGRSFMGTLLVDPKNVDRLIAPDLAGGLATSADGGRTWTTMGGPNGAKSVTWNPSDIREIVAVGKNGGARSTDGGATWQSVPLPEGASALSFDATGRTLYAAVLDGERARIYRSIDDGGTWSSTV